MTDPTAPLTDQQLAVIVSRLTYRPTLQGPESNPWLTLHNTVDGQERERFIAAAFTDVPVLLAELTRLRAELEQTREVARQEVAADITAHCLVHNAAAAHGWMTCHCEVADDLRRNTPAPAARPVPQADCDTTT